MVRYPSTTPPKQSHLWRTESAALLACSLAKVGSSYLRHQDQGRLFIKQTEIKVGLDIKCFRCQHSKNLTFFLCLLPCVTLLYLPPIIPTVSLSLMFFFYLIHLSPLHITYFFTRVSLSLFVSLSSGCFSHQLTCRYHLRHLFSPSTAASPCSLPASPCLSLPPFLPLPLLLLLLICSAGLERTNQTC